MSMYMDEDGNKVTYPASWKKWMPWVIGAVVVAVMVMWAM